MAKRATAITARGEIANRLFTPILPLLKSFSPILPVQLLPHDIYFGANYDLDEIWYGVTRWIARCSWGFHVDHSFHPRNAGYWHQSSTCHKQSHDSLSSPSSSSSWIQLDVEGEQSAFDSHDNTFRVGLIHQSCSRPLWQKKEQQKQHHRQQQIPSRQHHQGQQQEITMQQQQTQQRQISLEYDSPKYYSHQHHSPSYTLSNNTRTPYQAPTLSMKLQTPLFHPRLEVQSKSTWILLGGGGKQGNENPTSLHDSSIYSSIGKTNCVENRMEGIKERFRNGIPRSTTATATTTTTPFISASTTQKRGTMKSKLRNWSQQFNNWLENDGWMPRKVSTDLMGNLVSVNEIGFSQKHHGDGGDNIDDGCGGGDFNARQEQHGGISNGINRKTNNNAIIKSMMTSVLPPVHNMGIRLRISKKIDWTTLGIFPWSRNASGGGGIGGGGGSSSSGAGGNEFLDPLRSTRIKLEVCGLYDSEERWAWLGLDVDPLDWGRSWKVVVGQEDVRVWGTGH